MPSLPWEKSKRSAAAAGTKDQHAARMGANLAWQSANESLHAAMHGMRATHAGETIAG